MGQYKAVLNPFTGQLQLMPTNIVLAFKTGVATQASLPLTGNAKGDARIANDTGHLYVWSIDASSGLLTDWVDVGDIIDLNWSAISGRPSSSVADIDDAVNKRHTQGTDQGLDTGGLNATTAAQVKQAVTDDHTHSNKSILDNIQEALTIALKNAYDGVVSAFGLHKDATSGVHGVGSGDTLAKFSDITKANVGLPNVDNVSEATIITDVKADIDVADALAKRHDSATAGDGISVGVSGIPQEIINIDKGSSARSAHESTYDHTKLHNQNTDTGTSGNFDIVGELSIKVYSQTTEPILGQDNRMAIWIDTSDDYRVYLLFRRGLMSGFNTQVAVELA